MDENTKKREEIRDRIVKEALKHPLTKEVFRQAAMDSLVETTRRLQDKGVPDIILAEMGAHALAKMNELSYSEIARSLFPVEPMPEGASPVYFSEPESPDPVLPDPEDVDPDV